MFIKIGTYHINVNLILAINIDYPNKRIIVSFQDNRDSWTFEFNTLEELVEVESQF